jgi:DNA-binding NarL/FixJ family response regulator
VVALLAPPVLVDLETALRPEAFGRALSKGKAVRRLFISVPTAKSHPNSAFAKLGIRNRGQLAATAHCIEAP